MRGRLEKIITDSMYGEIDRCKYCPDTIPCKACVNGGGQLSPYDNMLGRKIPGTFLWRDMYSFTVRRS